MAVFPLFRKQEAKYGLLFSYGLAWNPTTAGEGHIISASEDTTVCHW